VSIVAGAIVLLVQRFAPSERPEAHIEATGFVFAVVGVLYAIVVAFIVIAVWDTMNQAHDTAYEESTALTDVYWYAQGLPQEQRAQIDQLSRQYTMTVIDQEWPRMKAHEQVGPAGWAQLDQLRAAITRSAPAADADGSPYQRVTDRIKDLYQARQARLNTATNGISPVVWFVLIGGGLLTIAFSYLFDVAGTSTQAILVVGLTAMVALLLFAVYELEYPYGRAASIGPDAFRFALSRFGQLTGTG
jgi:hypothetical protein